MSNTKLLNRVKAGLMSTTILMSAGLPAASVFVSADDAKPAAENTKYTANNGTVNLGYNGTTSVDGNQIPADGQITMKADPKNHSLKNKKFVVYKIFNVENAAGGESVNYSFVKEYKASVQKVVYEALKKRDGANGKAQWTIERDGVTPKTYTFNKYQDVSEYVALDYIQSLNTHVVEGATTQQKRESDTSAFRYFAEDVKNQIRKDGVAGKEIDVTSLNANNELEIQGLDWGYYLVDEVTTGDDITNGQHGFTPEGGIKQGASKDYVTEKQETDGRHFATSLVLVSTVNNRAVIQLKADWPDQKKEIREDDNRQQIGHAGVNNLGTFEIGQTIPFQHTATIPNMNGYETYYMAIRDDMDPEMTFHADKNKIHVYITDGNTDDYEIKGGHTYELQQGEYNLSTVKDNVSQTFKEALRPIDGNPTFYLEITDIKKIVDREFGAERKSSDQPGEINYDGLKLYTQYEGELNDKAGDKTGRPGFENGTEVVFSNNPEYKGAPEKSPTGKTPKDKVVAFTFKLNGLKVNSNNQTLANAHFRLYSSEPEGAGDYGSEENIEEFVKKNEGKEVFVKRAPGHDGPASEEGTVENANAAAEEGTTDATANSSTEAATTDANGAQAAAGEEAAADNSTTTSTQNGAEGTPGPKNTTGNVGTTTNIGGVNDKPGRGANQYNVINRDKVGGNDHEGGTKPAEATVIKTDDQGQFTVSGLDDGVYFLKEVKAPKGYRLLKDPIRIEIKAGIVQDRRHYVAGDGATEDKGLVSLTGTANIQEFYHEIFKLGKADLKTDVAKGEVDAKIVNEVQSKLPITGSQTMAVLMLVGAGVVSFGLYDIARRRKADREMDI